MQEYWSKQAYISDEDVDDQWVGTDNISQQELSRMMSKLGRASGWKQEQAKDQCGS